MKKTLLTLLTATLLFSCFTPGEYSEESFPTDRLPKELKGLKVYAVNISSGHYIYVAVLPNQNTSIQYKIGKRNETVVTIQAPDTLYSNDSIVILKRN